jgi:hypothetical protein
MKEVEEKDPVIGIQHIELTELKDGEEIFGSRGYSNVKVTRDGKIFCTKIPIKSTGVTELIEEFRKKEPKPPAVPVLVNKDSDEGKQMKLTENRWVKMPDLTDAKYLEKKEQYEGDLGIAILAKGIDLPFKGADGNEITDQGQRVQMLKKFGMSSDQFAQIVEDIRSLTMWSEQELMDFFGVS